MAGLGAAAVPRLQQVADGNAPEAAAAAVVALGLSGSPEARSALVEISAGHPDPELRARLGHPDHCRNARLRSTSTCRASPSST